MNGYLTQHWPTWFRPTLIEFQDAPLGPLEKSAPVTKDGRVVIVPLPGHTPGHVAVIVKLDEFYLFLGGDSSYNTNTVQAGIPDLILGNQEALVSMQKIQDFAREFPTVFLASHNPYAKTVLENRQTVFKS